MVMKASGRIPLALLVSILRIPPSLTLQFGTSLCRSHDCPDSRFFIRYLETGKETEYG
jgi:hypothetical protein